MLEVLLFECFVQDPLTVAVVSTKEFFYAKQDNIGRLGWKGSTGAKVGHLKCKGLGMII